MSNALYQRCDNKARNAHPMSLFIVFSRLLFAVRRTLTGLIFLVMGGALIGCTGTADSGSRTGAPPAPIATAPPNVDPAQATFAFEPFIGMPVNLADEFARAIGVEASRAGLRVVRRVGAPATFRVQGFLSAAGSRAGTEIFYVFDVFDSSKQRIARFVGREPGGSGTGDPWDGVNSSVVDSLARRVVMQIAAWLRSAEA